MQNASRASQFTVVVQNKQQNQRIYVTVDTLCILGVDTNACPEYGACHLNTMTSASTARGTVLLAATFHEHVQALGASGSTVVHFGYHPSVFCSTPIFRVG